MSLVYAAPIMLALPLAGFVVLAFAGRRIGNPWAGIIGTATVGGSFVVAVITFAGLLSRALRGIAARSRSTCSRGSPPGRST